MPYWAWELWTMPTKFSGGVSWGDKHRAAVVGSGVLCGIESHIFVCSVFTNFQLCRIVFSETSYPLKFLTNVNLSTKL